MKKNKVIASVIVVTILAWIVGGYFFWDKIFSPKNPEGSSPIIKSSEQLQLETKLDQLKWINQAVESQLRSDLLSMKITPLFATKIIDRTLSKAPFSQEIEQLIKNDTAYWSGGILISGVAMIKQLSVYAWISPKECENFYSARFYKDSSVLNYIKLCQDHTFFVNFLWDTTKVLLSAEDQTFITSNAWLYQQIVSVRKGQPFECSDRNEIFCPILLKGDTLASRMPLTLVDQDALKGLSYIDFGPLALYTDLTAPTFEQKISFFDEHMWMYRLFYTGDPSICSNMTTPSFIKICNDWINNRESQKWAFTKLLEEYLENLYIRSYVRA